MDLDKTVKTPEENMLELLEEELARAFAYDSESSSDYMRGLRDGLGKGIQIVKIWTPVKKLPVKTK